MDKNELVKTVVTIVITVIAKEVVQWLWSLVKTSDPARTITAKVKTAFNITNVSVFFQLCNLGWLIWTAFKFVTDPRPPTRVDIALFAGLLLFDRCNGHPSVDQFVCR